MCANYTPPPPRRLRECFNVDCADGGYPEEAFPGNLAPVIRLADDGSGELECVNACFGMVPSWAELKLARHTYNARSETVASKPSFRHAYAKRQRCIVPADAFFEPNYESGRAVRWKIAHDDQSPMGIAGLWEWRPNGGADDRPLLSFTMLTMNADTHPLMKRFHRPEDEKRMLVLLEPAQYASWLQAPADKLSEFLQPYPAERLIAEPAPRVSKTAGKSSRVPKAPRAMPRSGSPSLWDENPE